MASNTELLSGYDYEFVDQVREDYICSICHLTMRKPVQTRCGHRFCKDCLHVVLERKRECPLDKNYISSRQVFEDVATERQILSLHIKCPNQGCDWLGELRDLEAHDVNCPQAIMQCTYSTYGCKFEGPRRSLSEHYKSNLAEHLAITTQKLLPLQEDNTKLKRKVVENQKEMSKLKAKVLMLQNENKKQFLENKKQFLENKKQIFENEKQLLELKASKDDQSRCSYLWKINDFSHQLHFAKQYNHNSILESEPFYTDKYGYKLKLRLDPNGCGAGKGTHASVFMIIMRGEYDAILTWPFNWKWKFTLLDQKQDYSKRKNINNGSIIPNASWKGYQRPTCNENTGLGFPTFVSHETLQTENYVVDGVAFIKFEWESPSALQN